MAVIFSRHNPPALSHPPRIAPHGLSLTLGGTIESCRQPYGVPKLLMNIGVVGGLVSGMLLPFCHRQTHTGTTVLADWTGLEGN